jgi:hypothetical protein
MVQVPEASSLTRAPQLLLSAAICVTSNASRMPSVLFQSKNYVVLVVLVCCGHCYMLFATASKFRLVPRLTTAEV